MRIDIGCVSLSVLRILLHFAYPSFSNKSNSTREQLITIIYSRAWEQLAMFLNTEGGSNNIFVGKMIGA